MISVYEETLDQRFLKNTIAEGEHMKKYTRVDIERRKT